MLRVATKLSSRPFTKQHITLANINGVFTRSSSLSTVVVPSSEPVIPPEGSSVLMAALKPNEVVAQLDQYIVGQLDAKRAVAIALRNRWRRHQLPDDLKMEVIPKNILMIG